MYMYTVHVLYMYCTCIVHVMYISLAGHIILQMESLAPYKNKIHELSEAEQFGVVVSDVSVFRPRLYIHPVNEL